MEPPVSTKYQKPKKRSYMDNEDNFKYYEFEIEQIRSEDGTSIMAINIRDITSILKAQQDIIDEIYQDAIESNYSHEQMTPLNSIIGNSKIAYNRFLELHGIVEKLKESKDMDILNKNKETLMIIRSISQSGNTMWFYNQN